MRHVMHWLPAGPCLFVVDESVTHEQVFTTTLVVQVEQSDWCVCVSVCVFVQTITLN